MTTHPMHRLMRQHIEELVSLTDEEWAFMEPYFVYKKLKKHQFLVQEDNMVHHEYWIIKGLLKTYALDNEGKEHILHFAREAHWTSDYQAFHHQQPAKLFVECIEDSEFFCLRYEEREMLCNKIPAMANFTRIKSNRGYVALQQRILSLLTETAEQRYQEFTMRFPDLVQRIPKKLLAAYLGVSRETLSRFRS